VSVNEKKWLVMHMHVQLQLDELQGPQTLGSWAAMCVTEFESQCRCYQLLSRCRLVVRSE
jgi:hypothetical protein